jgi:hypothetical protein
MNTEHKVIGLVAKNKLQATKVGKMQLITNQEINNEYQPVQIADGTLEAIKWIAIVFMVLDHANKYLYNHSFPAFFALGRIAMPLFIYVMAFNMARRNIFSTNSQWRIYQRLTIFGIISSIPYMALGTVLGGWWPLNIMFTLLSATVIIGLIDHGGRKNTTLAVAIFAIAGTLVEYWWPALCLAIASWMYCKKPNNKSLFWLVLSCASLAIVNQNFWAMCALPIIILAPLIRLQVPRMKYFFYTFYPTHLALIFILQKYLFKAD